MVSSGKEYKLYSMIENLDKKVQAIGEMLERHLTSTASEQNPIPLPLWQTIEALAELQKKGLYAMAEKNRKQTRNLEGRWRN